MNANKLLPALTESSKIERLALIKKRVRWLARGYVYDSDKILNESLEDFQGFETVNVSGF